MIFTEKKKFFISVYISCNIATEETAWILNLESEAIFVVDAVDSTRSLNTKELQKKSQIQKFPNFPQIGSPVEYWLLDQNLL